MKMMDNEDDEEKDPRNKLEINDGEIEESFSSPVYWRKGIK